MSQDSQAQVYNAKLDALMKANLKWPLRLNVVPFWDDYTNRTRYAAMLSFEQSLEESHQIMNPTNHDCPVFFTGMLMHIGEIAGDFSESNHDLWFPYGEADTAQHAIECMLSFVGSWEHDLTILGLLIYAVTFQFANHMHKDHCHWSEAKEDFKLPTKKEALRIYYEEKDGLTAARLGLKTYDELGNEVKESS